MAIEKNILNYIDSKQLIVKVKIKKIRAYFFFSI